VTDFFDDLTLGKMRPHVAIKILTIFKWFCPLLFFFITIPFIIEAGNETLPVHAIVLSIFLMITIPIFTVSVHFLLAASRFIKRNRIPVFPIAGACITTFALHVCVIVLMIIEFTTESCEDDIFSICTTGKENFYAVVVIDVLVNLFFMLIWKSLHRTIDYTINKNDTTTPVKFDAQENVIPDGQEETVQLDSD
jgi:hypothetical protein